MIINCPGSQKFRQPEPKDIICPYCKTEAEIWTDEGEIVCPNCKNKIARSARQSCLDWCRYARECVGDEIYNRYIKNNVKK
jgi:DNA-directed RNA polymerase subunit RPC12/RpoP